MTNSGDVKSYDVIVIGGGAAGVGVSIALTHAGIENFIVLEKYSSVHRSRAGLRKHGSSHHLFQATRSACWI